MRVAVIGAGSMGGMHARLLGELSEVDEVLIVDADADRATRIAAEVGGRALTHDEAISAADAVVIATPSTIHAPSVEAAVAAGVPALCEKPLAEDLATSAALVELVEAAGARVAVGFQRRHDTGFAAARARISDGATGRVHLVHLIALDPAGPGRETDHWPVTDAAPIFLHSSVHDFDLARWLTGAEVAEVTAIGLRRDGSYAEDARDIETASVALRMAGGPLVTLDASWLHPGGYDVRAEVVAERAHLTIGLSERTPAEHLDWTDAAAGDRWTGYLARFADAYRAELRSFLAGEGIGASVRDGHQALRVAVAATRSHLARRAIAMDEVP